VRWRNLPPGGEPVQPFSLDQVEDANYVLSVGDEIYVSSPEEKSKIRKLTEEKPSFAIEPGQFAFILAAECVIIPFDVIGFISIRAHIKFLGLVNISGFHVDPGYSGKLIFAVFNAGPTRIHLKKGDWSFPLWLADLDGNIIRKTVKVGYENIPSKLINQISGQFTTAYQVKSQMDAIKSDVADLKAFKLHVMIVIALIGLLLFPTIRDRLIAIFNTPPSESGLNTAPSKAPPLVPKQP
jgi:dCTP deaminase